AARPAGAAAGAREPARVGGDRGLRRARRRRARAARAARGGRAVSGWGLLLLAVLVGAEAVRVHRRELRVRRPRRQRSTMAGMAAIGHRFPRRTAAPLAPATAPP